MLIDWLTSSWFVKQLFRSVVSERKQDEKAKYDSCPKSCPKQPKNRRANWRSTGHSKATKLRSNSFATSLPEFVRLSSERCLMNCLSVANPTD